MVTDEYEDDLEARDDLEGEDEDDASLSAALAAEWGSAPWYVSSVAIHALIFLMLLLLPAGFGNKPPTKIVITEFLPDEPEEEEEEEEEITEEKIETEVKDDVVVEQPIVAEADVEITDHIETEDEMEEETARGDPDNISTFDSESKGTPAVMGVGNSGGSGGGGRFGHRSGGGKRKAIRRGGGGRKTENAVNWGLKWLATHQEYDGHWDSQKYGAQLHGNTGPGVDAFVTAGALLAFLGAGNSTEFGKYRKNVRRAVEWLVSQQQPNGVIGEHRYVGGYTLMAIAEAYGMSAGYGNKKRNLALKAVAQKAVDWAVESQCPAGGWNYTPTAQRNDTSVTGWWVMGLKSAKTAGLNVPYEVMEKALKYIQKATNPGDYDKPSDGAVSYSSVTNTVDGVQTGIGQGKGPNLRGSPRRTAISLVCLQFLGRPRTDGQVIGTADRILKQFLPSAAGTDYYREYYATLGIFQMGGQHWKKYNESMKSAVLGRQIKTGSVKDKKGSWDHAGPYGKYWGRVAETAFGVLMLEVYYRYKEVHGRGKRSKKDRANWK